MHFLAQPPLGTDATAVAHQQHANCQLGIDRGTADGAVERLEVLADAAQLDKAVDAAQQVVGGDMLLQAEAVEQRLLPDRPLAHHYHALRRPEN